MPRLKKEKNPNHPKKGSHTKVEPIKKLKDVKAIKQLLENRPRDYCLFVLGINTNLRASDLLSLKAGQVRHLKPKGELELKERKTGKPRRITLNKAAVEAIQRLLSSDRYKADDYLFKSQRMRHLKDEESEEPSDKQVSKLTVGSVNKLVKSWCEMINLKGNYGSHTLRKTWGYHQRVTFKTELPLLMECFNHSTQKQTLAYLCIQPEEIKNVYNHEL